MIKNWIAALCAGLAALVIAAVVHDWIYPTEDSQIIWMCATDGTKTCAPGQFPVQIHIERFWEEP